MNRGRTLQTALLQFRFRLLQNLAVLRATGWSLALAQDWRDALDTRVQLRQFLAQLAVVTGDVVQFFCRRAVAPSRPVAARGVFGELHAPRLSQKIDTHTHTSDSQRSERDFAMKAKATGALELAENFDGLVAGDSQKINVCFVRHR